MPSFSFVFVKTRRRPWTRIQIPSFFFFFFFLAACLRPIPAVVGLALSRPRHPLVRFDLTDREAVKELVNSVSPDGTLVCALWPAPVRKLVAPRLKPSGFRSTRPLRSGTAPGRNAPYEVDAKPNPLNFYGLSKLRGEEAVLRAHANAAVLRVPVLYGEAESEDESAVNILITAVKVVRTRSPHAAVNLQAFFVRDLSIMPFVSDVARVIADLSEKRCVDGGDAT
ncbi:MAG: hypothetical protein BJ554DRAFT_3561, partial [Olpidium bornovanus]